MDTAPQPGGPHDEYLRNVFEGKVEREDDDTDRGSPERPALAVTPSSSPPSSPPRDFAPRGPVRARRAFRDRIPSPLNLGVPQLEVPNLANAIHLDGVQYAYTKAVNRTVDTSSSRTSRFLEVLKHIITSSRLLSLEPIAPLAGASLHVPTIEIDDGTDGHSRPWTTNGAISAAAIAFGLACLCRWLHVGGVVGISLKRLTTAVVLVLATAFTTSVYMRRQWLIYITEQTAAQANALVRCSDEFDSAAAAACNFIMEVELVARGYRISLPLPPVSRMESQAVANGQNLRSLKTRRTLLGHLKIVAEVFHDNALKIRQFSNQTQLKQLERTMFPFPPKVTEEEYQALMGDEHKDAQTTVELKEFFVLVQKLRKMFLIGLVSLDSTGVSSDYLKFTLALESLCTCNEVTQNASHDIRHMLNDDETFAEMKSPSAPQTPGHKHWRMQVRKIGNMNTSIRGLQAKMALLAEDSTKCIEDSEDLSQLGPLFMDQYESIGKDLKTLMEEWEAGKSTLASSITKTERRLSSRSSVMSPYALSELASVSEEDGSPSDAYRRLEGDSSPTTEPSDHGSPKLEVFEAIALEKEKPRSRLSRAQRIEKMQKDRDAKAAAREKALENGWVLNELKEVLGRRDAPSPSPAASRSRQRFSMPILPVKPTSS